LITGIEFIVDNKREIPNLIAGMEFIAP